jgi:hypothetical protein
MLKILEFFSCIDNPQSKNVVDPLPKLYTIKTLQLIDDLKDIPPCKEKDDFLDWCPYSSNYIIDNSIYRSGLWKEGTIVKLEKVHYPSNTSIRRHTLLHGLTWECEVTFNVFLLNKYNDVLKLKKTQPHY